jgi:hypothetical protein
LGQLPTFSISPPPNLPSPLAEAASNRHKRSNPMGQLYRAQERPNFLISHGSPALPQTSSPHSHPIDPYPRPHRPIGPPPAVGFSPGHRVYLFAIRIFYLVHFFQGSVYRVAPPNSLATALYHGTYPQLVQTAFPSWLPAPSPDHRSSACFHGIPSYCGIPRNYSIKDGDMRRRFIIAWSHVRLRPDG